MIIKDLKIQKHLKDNAPAVENSNAFMADLKRQIDLLPETSKTEQAIAFWEKLSRQEYVLNFFRSFALTGTGAVVVGGICLANFGAIISFISMIVSKL